MAKKEIVTIPKRVEVAQQTLPNLEFIMDIVHVEVRLKNLKSKKLINKVVTRSAYTFNKMLEDVGHVVTVRGKKFQVLTIKQAT